MNVVGGKKIILTSAVWAKDRFMDKRPFWNQKQRTFINNKHLKKVVRNDNEKENITMINTNIGMFLYKCQFSEQKWTRRDLKRSLDLPLILILFNSFSLFVTNAMQWLMWGKCIYVYKLSNWQDKNCCVKIKIVRNWQEQYFYAMLCCVFWENVKQIKSYPSNFLFYPKFFWEISTDFKKSFDLFLRYIWFVIYSGAGNRNVKQLAAELNSQIQLIWQRRPGRKILSDIGLYNNLLYFI